MAPSTKRTNSRKIFCSETEQERRNRVLRENHLKRRREKAKQAEPPSEMEKKERNKKFEINPLAMVVIEPPIAPDPDVFRRENEEPRGEGAEIEKREGEKEGDSGESEKREEREPVAAEEREEKEQGEKENRRRRRNCDCPDGRRRSCLRRRATGWRWELKLRK